MFACMGTVHDSASKSVALQLPEGKFFSIEVYDKYVTAHCKSP